MKKKQNRINEETQLKVISAYQAYAPFKKICQDFNISVQYIANILKRHGIARKYDNMRRPIRKNFNRDYFQMINTPDKAYWLGMLMGDGWIQNNSLALCLKDKDVIDSFLKSLDSDANISRRKNCAGALNSYEVRHNCQKMIQDLAKYGMVNNKTHRTTMSDLIPENFKRDFIRGYFDADGCFYVKDKFVATIVSSSHLVLEQIEVFLRRCGIIGEKPHINYQITKSGESRYSILAIQKREEFYKFGKWLYADANLFLQRKFDKFQQAINHPYFFGKRQRLFVPV